MTCAHELSEQFKNKDIRFGGITILLSRKSVIEIDTFRYVDKKTDRK